MAVTATSAGPVILRCPQHLKNELGLWEPNIEWLDAKLGIPSASSFKRILTSTGALSKGRTKYMAELLAEWALGEHWGERRREIAMGPAGSGSRAGSTPLVRDGLPDGRAGRVRVEGRGENGRSLAGRASWATTGFWNSSAPRPRRTCCTCRSRRCW